MRSQRIDQYQVLTLTEMPQPCDRSLAEITPLILTYNEAPNLDRVLQHLTWATRIVVIDSFSTDATLDIAKSYPQIEVFQRTFDTHAQQWNYGLAQVRSAWVLSLDADYLVPAELRSEIQALSLDSKVDGYFVRFKYCVFGKPLRGTILPPRQVLSRTDRSHYVDDGHTECLQVQGASAVLKNYLYHDDRKSLDRWLWAQSRYMPLEVKKLSTTPDAQLNLADRIRKTKVLAPIAVLFYCLILKGGILDGWIGWYYALQRVLAEILLSLYLMQTEYKRD